MINRLQNGASAVTSIHYRQVRLNYLQPNFTISLPILLWVALKQGAQDTHLKWINSNKTDCGRYLNYSLVVCVFDAIHYLWLIHVIGFSDQTAI